MRSLINKLPKRFQWTIHNMIGHPLMEIVYQLGFSDLSTSIHIATSPEEEYQTLSEED